MALEIGALRALLSLDSAAFEKGAKRAQASMNGLQRSLSKSAAKMKSIGRKMTTRMTLPLAGLATVAVKSSLSTIDAQSKMAQSLNTSTRSMQVLERAADRAGISTGELEQVGRQLTKRLSQVAATGKGPAAGALERIGLKAGDLAKLDLDQKIAVINRAIKDMIPEAEQASVAMALFGDRAGIMAGRLDADTIATAADEIERFGIAVTEVDADKIEEANDAISAIGLVTRGLANQLAVSLAPTLKTIAERIADVGAWFSSLSPQMRRFIGIAAAVAAAIGPLAIALGFVASGMVALASPIGLAVLALGAVAGAAALVAANWDAISEKAPALASAMQKVGDTFKASIAESLNKLRGMADVAGGLIETIAGLFTGDLTRAVDGLKQSWQGLEEIGRASMNALLGIMEAIVPGFGQAATDIIAAVSALPGRLKQWGADAIQSFVDGIKEKWIELKETVLSIFRMNDVGAEAIEAGKKLGRDLGHGSILGMRQTLPQAKSEIRGYLNSLEGEARDETETQSPSRVWMRLGQDLMDGLGLGIDGKTQEAAQRAAAAAAQVSAAAGAASPVISKVPDHLREAADETSNLNGRLAGMFSSAIQGAQSFSGFLSNILGQLGDMLINSAFSGLFGGLEIPGFAKGTNNAPGGMAWVGERGPELVNLPRGSQVIPNHKINTAGGGSITFAPSIDARGADVGAVQRLEAAMAKSYAEFEGKVINTMNVAKKRRQFV